MPGISGKKVVAVLYGSAVLVCAGLLWFGISRLDDRPGVPLPESDRLALAEYPRAWTRISRVEGQGWVVFVPCNAEAGSLVIESDAESPRLLCAWCDTIQEALLRRVSFAGSPPRSVTLKLGAGGLAVIEPVDSAVSARFAGALLRDYVLTWALPGGGEMFFVPAENARDFEILRAEDESPEGCGVE